jgi:DnaJ homolog subfamily C member 7
MKFFSKKSSKTQPDDTDDDSLRSPSPSPTKASASKTPKPSSGRLARPASPSLRESKPRTSARRKRIDPDLHPLNFDPAERSRLAAMANRDSMEIDREPVNGGPSSPLPQSPAAQHHPPPQAPNPSITVPITNGGSSPMKVDGDVPVPPPHRSQPTSPIPTPAAEAEAYKAAGNKFFKEKDYRKAIDEYTKGIVHVRMASHSTVGKPC